MQNMQNNMAQVAKTQKPKKKKQHIISRADRKKLAIAHYQMYRAMFLKGLLSGKTIGAASHNAFEFIKAKLSTMDKNNPVTKFLLRINKHRSKRIARRIMPSINRDAMAAFMPEYRKKAEVKIPQWLNKSLNVINMLSAQYKPKQKTVARPVQKPTELPTIKQNKRVLVEFISVIADARAFAAAHQRTHNR